MNKKRKKKLNFVKGKRKYGIEQTYQEENEDSRSKRISRENEVMKKSAELKVIKEMEKKYGIKDKKKSSTFLI